VTGHWYFSERICPECADAVRRGRSDGTGKGHFGFVLRGGGYRFLMQPGISANKETGYAEGKTCEGVDP